MGTRLGKKGPLDYWSQALVRQYYPLVYYWCRKILHHINPGDREDAAQYGVAEGLIRAAQLFDWKSAKFNTYASLWIKQALQRWSDKKVREHEVKGRKIVILGSTDSQNDNKELDYLQDVADLHESPAQTHERKDFWGACHKVLANDTRAWLCIRLLYRQQFTLVQIGRRLHISKERVRQLLLRARKLLAQRLPREYTLAGGFHA